MSTEKDELIHRGEKARDEMYTYLTSAIESLRVDIPGGNSPEVLAAIEKVIATIEVSRDSIASAAQILQFGVMGLQEEG